MTTYIIVFLIIILLSLLISAYLFLFKSISLQLDKIKSLIDENKIDLAQEKLFKLLKKNKDNGRIHFFLGQIYEKKGDFRTAISEYLKCLRNVGFISESEQYEIHSRLADLYFKIKNFDEALGEYLLLSKKFPDDPYYLAQIGEIFFIKKKFNHAVNYLKKSIEIESNNAKAHYNLGRIYFFSGLKNDAERHLLKAIDLLPSLYDAYYYLGLVYLQMGEPKKALNALSEAVKSKKFKGQAFYNIGIILESSGNCEKAIRYLLKASEVVHDMKIWLEANYKIAHCYEQMKDIDKALKFWKKIYEKQKEYKDVEKKILIYSELTEEDKLKEYTIAKPDDFNKIVQAILGYFGFKPLDIFDFGSIVYSVAIPMEISHITATKKENNFFVFFRDVGKDFLMEDLLSLKNKMVKNNCSRLHIIFPGNFSEDVLNYANTRNINLIGKDRLIEILKNIKF